MSKCLIDATCVGEECKNCSNYDYKTSVEIRVFDHKTNNVECKRLTRSELENLRRILNLRSI